MAMTVTELQERINIVINLALASGLPYGPTATAGTICFILNQQLTALNAAAPHHGRTIEEPGQILNTHQP
jgi:hypothetical protein